MPKKVLKTAIRGIGGEALAQLILSSFSITRVSVFDYGIDIYGTLVKDESPTNNDFLVQVKLYKGKPKISKDTRELWSKLRQPVFVLWIQNDCNHQPNSDELFKFRRYLRMYPSLYSQKIDRHYVEYTDDYFVAKIEDYWSNLDKVVNSSSFSGNISDISEAKNQIGSTSNQDVKHLRTISSKISSNENLNEYDKIRLYLFSASNLFSDTLQSNVLENHEIQLLYKYKSDIELNSNESIQIIRSILSDEYVLRTGWFWLHIKDEKEGFIFICRYFLRNDHSEDLVKGVITQLGNYWDDAFIDDFKDTRVMYNQEVKVHELEVLKKVHRKSVLSYIEKYKNDSSVKVREKYKTTYTKLFTILYPHASVDFILNSTYFDKYSIDPALYSRLNEAELKRLLSTNENSIKVKVFNELVNRDVLETSELPSYFSEDNWEIRFLSIKNYLLRKSDLSLGQIEEILKRGNTDLVFSLLTRQYNFEVSELYEIYFSDKKYDDLLQEMRWGFGSEKIYILQSTYFESFIDVVRSDIRDKFLQRKADNLRLESSKVGLSVAELTKIYEKYDDSIIDGYLEAGLNFLLKCSEPCDKSIAYEYCDSEKEKIKSIARNMIFKHAASVDIPLLVSFAESSKSYDFYSKACDISKDKKKLLLETKKNLLFIKFFLRYSIENKVNYAFSEIEPLLKHSDDDIRLLAVFLLFKTKKLSQLRKVLNDYTKSGHYYYNVVASLDILLFSPEFFKKSYLRLLQDKTNGVN